MTPTELRHRIALSLRATANDVDGGKVSDSVSLYWLRIAVRGLEELAAGRVGRVRLRLVKGGNEGEG